MIKYLYIYLFFISTSLSQIEFNFNDSTTGFEGRLLAYPILNYSTDTKIGYGAGGRYFYRKSKDREISTLTPILMYTQNKQLLSLVEFDHYYQNSHIYGKVGYKKFPTNFYGIGSDSDIKNKEKYTPKLFEIYTNYEVSYTESYSFGVGINFQSVSFDSFELNKQLIELNLNGLNSNKVVGLNIVNTYDTRDHKLNTYSGFYGRLDYQKFSSNIGSDLSFSKFKFDVRNFIPLKNLIIASQVNMEFSSSKTPFTMLPRLGGPKSLRGMSLGRYIDRNLFFLQMEFRYKFHRQLSIVPFLGMGSVNNNAFRYKSIHTVYGIGGRMHYPGKERITFRIDVGLSKDGNQIYLEINEAF